MADQSPADWRPFTARQSVTDGADASGKESTMASASWPERKAGRGAAAPMASTSVSRLLAARRSVLRKRALAVHSAASRMSSRCVACTRFTVSGARVGRIWRPFDAFRRQLRRTGDSGPDPSGGQMRQPTPKAGGAGAQRSRMGHQGGGERFHAFLGNGRAFGVTHHYPSGVAHQGLLIRGYSSGVTHQGLLIRGYSSGVTHQGLLIRESSRDGNGLPTMDAGHPGPPYRAASASRVGACREESPYRRARGPTGVGAPPPAALRARTCSPQTPGQVPGGGSRPQSGPPAAGRSRPRPGQPIRPARPRGRGVAPGTEARE